MLLNQLKVDVYPSITDGGLFSIFSWGSVSLFRRPEFTWNENLIIVKGDEFDVNTCKSFK